MKLKEESKKVGLKLNIQKTKIMGSCPMATISLLRFYEFDFYRGCGIKETLVETVADCVFWGSKITADGDCSKEIKRHSLEGRL